MNKPIVSAFKLGKLYPGGAREVRALDGVSLDIEKGSLVSIVGPSGAGKSTLLHVLGGLDCPSSGGVMLDGQDLYGISDSRRSELRNRRIGFVFQFYNLLPEFTAIENVMLPALMRRGPTRLSRKAALGRASELLASVGLEDRMDHRPGQLSGGESQRVAIARAIMNEPDLILCDEPTGNLDSLTSEIVYQALFEIVSKSGATLIIITHDENLSRKTGRVIRMKDGKIL